MLYRAVVLAAVLVLATSVAPVITGSTSAQSTLCLDLEVARACRGFENRATITNGIQTLDFLSVPADDRSSADGRSSAIAFFKDLEESAVWEEAGGERIDTGQTFGNEHLAVIFRSGLPNGKFEAMLVFREHDVMSSWSASGFNVDPVDTWGDIYRSLMNRPVAGSLTGRVMRLLPDASDLPPGFVMTYEEIEGLESSRQSDNAGAGSSSTSGSTSTSGSSSQDLELLSITSKDAGIGNGSIYVYVEVRNNSSKSYSFISLSGTCRDRSGSVVGTGFGTATNVAPRQTVVATMIFLSVPTCDKVEVRIDSAF
jgi:hypothetical protein